MEHEEEVVAHAKIDPEAFGRLYDAYYQPVFGFLVKRTGNVEVAKDLTSETFFQALKNLRRYAPRPGKSFKSWLFAIAVAQVGTYFRAKAKWLSLSTEACPELVADDRFDPRFAAVESEEAMERKRQTHRLRQALGKLNPKLQNILSLRYFSQLSIAEIASALNMKEGTIKSHIHRAMKKLHAMLSEPEAVEETRDHVFGFFYANRPNA